MMFKIIDSIHGEIFLPNYIQEIISTKEFERLKNIRQLGVSYYYYKKANHSRYEHSIGTAYLCIKILEILEHNSKVKIDETHKKCVVLAGLFHDVGHGAFSHLWENVVRKGCHKNWTHEEQSVLMTYHMINRNNIRLHSDSKVHDAMMELTSSLITGDIKVWKKMLTPSDMFLTEIVSNKFCNIDVDKFDYIMRDFKCVGRELKPFQFLDGAKIVYDETAVSHVGYHVKDFDLIENLFINRANYHMDVYQKLEVVAIEKQVRDVFYLANSAGFQFSGMLLTEVQQSCEKYCQLDDNILDLFRAADNPQMKEAKELLENLDNGNFYQMIYETKDKNEVRNVLHKLNNKFGDVFCTVEKFIPNARVPDNVPLYDNDGNNVQRKSNQRLEYSSTIIFCKAFDVDTVQNSLNYLANNNYM